MPTLLSSGFRPWSRALSLIRRTAVCGPACTVVWEGRTGNRLPYPDFRTQTCPSALLLVLVVCLNCRKAEFTIPKEMN
jgi:hypothetical protein